MSQACPLRVAPTRPSTACIRGCISAMGLSLGGRYRWFYIFFCVSGRQSSFRFYLHCYHMYMYQAFSLRRLIYRRTPDISRTFVTIVVRTAVFRARGPGSITYRCSLPPTSEFASRSGSPYLARNTHLGGFACGPRLGGGGSRKKGRRDLVTRSLLSNPAFTFLFFQTQKKGFELALTPLQLHAQSVRPRTESTTAKLSCVRGC